MESIMPFIIFIALMAAFFYFNSPLDRQTAALQQVSVSQDEESTSQEQTEKKQSFAGSGFSKTPLSKTPSVFIDTVITEGPKEGEIIEETNKITFEFKFHTLPTEIKERVYFETKVVGLDTDWIKTYSGKRTITFPSGSREYTFFVRARTKSFVDQNPDKRSFRINISPYFHKVNIYSLSLKSSSRPSQITLSTNLSRDERINITNWYIKGKEGKFIIPKAVEKYYHYYNSPLPTDILVKRSDRVYLSSGFNPLGRDKNFRLNRCMGYLLDSFSFPILISRDCPKPSSKDISHLEICCQRFIRSLRTCEIPEYSDKAKVYSDSECVSYLNENFNNVGCFKNYSQDENFLKSVWHIYLNGKDITTKNDCDILYLRDQNGLLVDSYSYGRAVCW